MLHRINRYLAMSASRNPTDVGSPRVIIRVERSIVRPGVAWRMQAFFGSSHSLCFGEHWEAILMRVPGDASGGNEGSGSQRALGR